MVAGTEKPGVPGDRLALKTKLRGGFTPLEMRISKGARRKRFLRGFTLIELLVVMSIITVLMGILVPALGKVRRHVRAVVGIADQRQIVTALNCYALEHDDFYPDSVATIGGEHWNWQEPTMLTGYRKRSPKLHRSMSSYLQDYISEASTMSCRSAPREHRYLQQAWDAGEDWGNPEEPNIMGPLTGTYCFYWNYTGLLPEQKKLFRGPSGTAGGQRESKMLVSCYLGYDHWRSREVYSSCEKFGSANITEETWFASPYWSSRNPDANLDALKVKLHAGYTDGHVETYSPSEVVPMKVIMNRATAEPYPSGIGPGAFYLPENALY